MAFDYDAETKRAYQDDRVAEAYHEGFAGGRGKSSLAHRVVARKEREGIAALLAKVPHTRVLDVPCGTGKLAGVFASLGCQVVAGDVSANMISIARREYAQAGLGEATFKVLDITRLTDAGVGRFDTAVCLRLLHRVPAPVKTAALHELARCARHVIASFGIETPFHKARRTIRNAIFGGGTSALCFETLSEVRERVVTDFEVVEQRWVFRGVSQEILLLLRSRVGN